jgi:AcrR family transcriptional regulator
MTDRRKEILDAAIELISDEGYASLTMRALARQVGIKLASLQYHFKSFDELLRAVVAHVGNAYSESFATLYTGKGEQSLPEIIEFVMEDKAGDTIYGDRLWPQLWAMQQVEPLVSNLLEEIYANYIKVIESALRKIGAKAPHTDALLLMSMMEGSTIFMGEGRPWQEEANVAGHRLLELVNLIYRNDTT